MFLEILKIFRKTLKTFREMLRMFRKTKNETYNSNDFCQHQEKTDVISQHLLSMRIICESFKLIRKLVPKIWP